MKGQELVGWRDIGWIEEWVHEWRRDPAEVEGTRTHLDGLGVLLQPLVNRGDGQGWLGLLHTVTGGEEKGHGPGPLTQLLRPP